MPNNEIDVALFTKVRDPTPTAHAFDANNNITKIGLRPSNSASESLEIFWVNEGITLIIDTTHVTNLLCGAAVIYRSCPVRIRFSLGNHLINSSERNRNRFARMFAIRHVVTFFVGIQPNEKYVSFKHDYDLLNWIIENGCYGSGFTNPRHRDQHCPPMGPLCLCPLGGVVSVNIKEVRNCTLGSICSLTLSLPIGYFVYIFLSSVQNLDLSMLSTIAPPIIVLAFLIHGFIHPKPYKKGLGLLLVLWDLLFNFVVF